MKKLLKILPIAILMAGIVACSPETETTSSSSSAKPTNSTTQVETKPSSSEETPISSESTEGTVSSEESTTGGDSSVEEEDNKSIEVLASEFNVPEAGWADNGAGKIKLPADFTLKNLTISKDAEYDDQGKDVTLADGTTVNSNGRVKNVKVLTFTTFYDNSTFTSLCRNTSSSKVVTLTLADSTGAAIQTWHSNPSIEEAGQFNDPEVLTISDLAAGTYTLTCIEDSSSKAAGWTYYYFGTFAPADAA